MNLHVLPAGMLQTNAYLLVAPERGEAVLIDAPGEVWAEVAPILEKERSRLAVTQGRFTQEHFIEPHRDVLESWLAQNTAQNTVPVA